MIFKEEEKYKHSIGIYSIRNLINNKVYIGQTSQNFQRRYWHHQWKLKDNTHDNYHLQAAWNKYGEDNFVFEVIECVIQKDIDYINKLEIDYIKEYRNKNLCYNISDGGDGTRGVPMSEKTKKIVGEANRRHNLGKKASEETKKKMSESHLKNSKEIARRRSNTILDINKVIEIKEKLILGISDKNLSEEYNCNVNTIRNIKYEHSWNDIYVDGWKEYQKTLPRKVKSKSDKYTEEEINSIIKDYKNGMSLRNMELKYHRARKTMNIIFKDRNITR